MSTSIAADLTEATSHKCWLIAGERTARFCVRPDAFDAKRRCLAARPRSMLWPSCAAHGLQVPGCLPPALKRWPEVSQPAGAASERGPNRLSRSPPPRPHAQPRVVPHWECRRNGDDIRAVLPRVVLMRIVLAVRFHEDRRRPLR